VPHALDGSRLAARCPELKATPLDAALVASLAALGVGDTSSETRLAPMRA